MTPVPGVYAGLSFDKSGNVTVNTSMVMSVLQQCVGKASPRLKDVGEFSADMCRQG